MLKALALIVLLACVSAVPVNQVPDEKGSEVKKADSKPEEKKVAVEPKTETKTTETKTEAKKEPEDNKTELKKDVKANATANATATPPNATSDLKVDTKKSVSKDLEKIKETALNQVMSFVSDMAQPMSHDESKALKDIISAGSDILVEAEKKAREMHSKLDTMNLLQTDNLFGIKKDGSVDTNEAANQVTELMAHMASPSNPLTDAEKGVLHDLVEGFANAFAPTKQTVDAIQKDLEGLAGEFTSKIDVLAKQALRDDLLNPQNLLNAFAGGKGGVDSKAITDLTDKFLKTLEQQFTLPQEHK